MNSADKLSRLIIDASMKIHTELGPGLLESVYEVVLAKILEKKGIKIERQKPITFKYEGIIFNEGLRVDLMIDNQVIVELKSVEKLAPVHSKQLLSYLRLCQKPLGLLINFGEAHLKDGLHRIVNNGVMDKMAGF